jgi:hypothetical protein
MSAKKMMAQRAISLSSNFREGTSGSSSGRMNYGAFFSNRSSATTGLSGTVSIQPNRLTGKSS